MIEAAMILLPVQNALGYSIDDAVGSDSDYASSFGCRDPIAFDSTLGCATNVGTVKVAKYNFLEDIVEVEI